MTIKATIGDILFDIMRYVKTIIIVKPSSASIQTTSFIFPLFSESVFF
jgi:hypothetical protein